MPYLHRATCLRIVQLVTLARAGGAVIFASIALSRQYHRLASVLYICALATDLLDGWLARKLNAATELGAALDGLADKYVTIVSTLFLAALGLPLAACCLILLRDIVIQGLRTVTVKGSNLFYPHRLLGGISGLPIRLLTLAILINDALVERYRLALVFGAWIAAALSILSLAYSLYRDRNKIAQALDGDA